ncbi:hypothetical protein [Limnohabitans sp. JirII-31]|uniref:DUF6900 domain-containing protein n=1 Tax=Limnohabitans sp. JirII-31 TaxID=1977908 RepID=UPI000C1F7F13|nr:hypothetical protein [Limnohabitans sp. JirII-31]PIT76670.1 hypothetical protein B9Z41_10240 [Limnohabitans sp. JirII-31]
MNHHTTTNAITAPSSLLEQIALKHFFVQTLQTQNRDSLDFHDVSVWAIESALKAAFEAGVQAGQQAALKEKTKKA